MRLKQFLLVIGCMLSSVRIQAQSANLVTAYNYYVEEEYAKAKEYIDKAADHPVTEIKAKTWKYKGDIYVAYYTEKEGGINSESVLKEILESYQKAIDLDERYAYESDIRKQWLISQNLYLNQGVQLFNERKYTDSYAAFVMTNMIADFLGEKDSLAMFNAGLAAERLGKDALAIEWYDKCEQMGYKGANCCSFSIYLHRKMGDTEAMKRRLAECRRKYPEDGNLLVTDINLALSENRLSDAVDLLKIALKNDPQNHIMNFTLGTAYDGLSQYDEAEKCYLKALSVNSGYFDATYNLGALYFNMGVDANNQMSDESNPDKYLALKSETEGLFDKALPLLEKAHELKPNDLNTLDSLKQLYARKNMSDAYNEVVSKMEKLQGN